MPVGKTLTTAPVLEILTTSISRENQGHSSGLRNEVLKIIKEPLLKAWHTVRMMAALFVLDNFKVGVDRQQTAGVFIPKSCSELFFASNKLCWTQERSLS